MIRIEPDWNVNETFTVEELRRLVIRIEPDWNVNVAKHITPRLPL